MSMILTRPPLESIGMNGAGTQKRRSARLSHELAGENEPPNKKAKTNGAAATTTVQTKQQDGGSKAAGNKKQKVYDEEVEGFSFSKGKRKKAVKDTSAPGPAEEESNAALLEPALQIELPPIAPAEETVSKPVQKKTRRKLPTTPERDAPAKTTKRSKRLADEDIGTAPQRSPQRPSHAQSHTNVERAPSPENAQPVTVEKTRKRGAAGVEDEKVMRIMLPFADTPIIRRNREMRKGSDGSRRSSSGLRGRRASSLIDEGRGHGQLHRFHFSTSNPPAVPSARPREAASPSTYILSQDCADSFTCAIQSAQSITHDGTSQANNLHASTALPHAEVATTDFFKHISADLTEPRRMRCLLGWCGIRSLPPATALPKDGAAEGGLELEARRAARKVQEELSSDLMTKGSLSDWFSRDESVPPPQMPARKRPNPRNLANAAKVEELTRELERLQKERKEWDEVVQSATIGRQNEAAAIEAPDCLSPLRSDLLDTPQRDILEQLLPDSSIVYTDASAIQQRLRNISENLEFAVDQFADGVHALEVTQNTAERLAERSLASAASALEERHRQRTAGGKSVDPINALRGLAKVLNAKYK